MRPLASRTRACKKAPFRGPFACALPVCLDCLVERRVTGPEASKNLLRSPRALRPVELADLAADVLPGDSHFLLPLCSWCLAYKTNIASHKEPHKPFSKKSWKKF